MVFFGRSVGARATSLLGTALALQLVACAGSERGLALRRVVLYQNGIGYFERSGELHGDRFRVQLKSHEVGDVLKSLVVIDKGGGRGDRPRAVSAVIPQPSPGESRTEQTWLDLLLQGRGRHELTVSYAVPTPVWKPSYRVVLPDSADQPGGAPAETTAAGGLLQAWAVVDNASGEPWQQIELVLATGAPLSFAMDMRTPHFVARPDLTGHLVQPVNTGIVESERTQAAGTNVDAKGPDRDSDGIPDSVDKCPDEPETYNGMSDDDGCPDRGRVVVTASRLEVLDKIYFKRDSSDVQALTAPILDALAATLKGNPSLTLLEVQGHACAPEHNTKELSERRAAAVRYQLTKRGVAQGRLTTRGYGAEQPVARGQSEDDCARNRRVEFVIKQHADTAPAHEQAPPRSGPAAVTVQNLQDSGRSLTTPQDLAGATRYQVSDPVTLPKGTSTMVSLLTLLGGTEDIYLFRPDRGIAGSDQHPLRAARVRIGVALEPGPVAVFARGSFVGEGVLTRMHAGETALIPYAIDSAAHVESSTEEKHRPLRLVSLRSGEAVVEDEESYLTHYEITAGQSVPARIFIRHPQRGGYTAPKLPADTESGAQAYLVPHPLVAGQKSTLTVDELRTTRRTLALKSGTESLAPYLEVTRLPDPLMARLRELEALQKDSLRRTREVEELHRELDDLRGRAEELRENLRTIEKIASAATLRAELITKLTSNERKSDEAQKQLIARTETQVAAAARLAQLLSELRID